jgi:hypothetical protein
MADEMDGCTETQLLALKKLEYLHFDTDTKIILAGNVTF